MSTQPISLSETLFTDLQLPMRLTNNLLSAGFKKLTPIQDKTIPVGLDGRDVLGQAQTGTGKTAAFAVPVVTSLLNHDNTQCLILAPTRELALQIFRVMRNLTAESKIKGVLVVGGESYPNQQRRLKARPRYIVATPGRLVDHMQRRTVDLRNISSFVLDEVDRMLDMGFQPQLARIMQQVPKKRQTYLFSATLPQALKKDIDKYLKNPVRISVGPENTPSADIKQISVETQQKDKTELLIKHIESDGKKVLVFTRTKRRTDRLMLALAKQGKKVTRLHSGRNQRQRQQALNGFRSGAFNIMVATDVAGRGIDVHDINLVVNYDMPATREDYIHRIGRTGRLGKQGTALNFVAPEESQSWSKMCKGQESECKRSNPQMPGKKKKKRFFSGRQVKKQAPRRKRRGSSTASR